MTEMIKVVRDIHLCGDPIMVHAVEKRTSGKVTLIREKRFPTHQPPSAAAWLGRTLEGTLSLMDLLQEAIDSHKGEIASFECPYANE